MFTSLVKPLFDGPIDIVGDVHGEIGALHSLLTHLGYDSERVVVLDDGDREPVNGLA
jgi:hypothetical protein